MANIFAKMDRIIYWFLLVNQANSFLSKISPEYAQFIESTNLQIKKKLGLQKSLLDEINSYIKTDVLWGRIEVFSKDQNHVLEAFLYDNFKITKTIRNRKECLVKNDFQLSLGELYLDTIDSSTYVCDDIERSIRTFAEKPEFLKYEQDIYRKGFTASRISFGFYDGIPIVFQRAYQDENTPLCINFMTSQPERLKQKFETYVKNESFFKNWICHGLEKNGKLEFEYLEQPCIELRHKKYEVNHSLFTPEAKDLIKAVKQFIKIQHHLKEIGHESKRSYIIAGPSGSGKSVLIKTIIANMPSYYTTLVLSENNINILAKINQYPFLFPLLLIVEDIDLLLSLSDNKLTTRMLKNFLNGFNSPGNIISIMTCTDMSGISKLLTDDTGCVDKIITLEVGNLDLREKQIHEFTKNIKLPETYSARNLAEKLENSTLSTIKETVRQALIYSQHDTENVTTISEEALKKALSEMTEKQK